MLPLRRCLAVLLLATFAASVLLLLTDLRCLERRARLAREPAVNTDKLAAYARAVDAVICWHITPKWRRRGRLVVKMRCAYRRGGCPLPTVTRTGEAGTEAGPY